MLHGPAIVLYLLPSIIYFSNQASKIHFFLTCNILSWLQNPYTEIYEVAQYEVRTPAE